MVVLVPKKPESEQPPASSEWIVEDEFAAPDLSKARAAVNRILDRDARAAALGDDSTHGLSLIHI